jgi:hypothetical protein
MSDVDIVREALEEARAIATGYVDWDREASVRWFTEALDAFNRIVEVKP